LSKETSCLNFTLQRQRNTEFGFECLRFVAKCLQGELRLFELENSRPVVTHCLGIKLGVYRLAIRLRM